MITVIHGDNIAASRDELTKYKKAAKGKEIRDINGKDVTEESLRQATESRSLFGEQLFIVIEGLCSSLGRKEKQLALYSTILTKAGESADIVLWEPKEIGKTAITAFPQATVKLFKLPPVIFTFLDSISPDAPAAIIENLKQTLQTQPPELILYMLQTRIRMLVQAKNNCLPAMSPWQAGRLTKQAKSFTIEKLLYMHAILIDIEYKYKTGITPLPLKQLLINYFLTIS